MNFSRFILIGIFILVGFSAVFFLYQKNQKESLESSVNALAIAKVYAEDLSTKSTATNTKTTSNANENWDEINKLIAKTEEEINSENYSGLEKLKELITNNPKYPRKTQVEAAIKNWEHEKGWAEITKQITVLEKKLNAGNYAELETLQTLMDKNPTYPMKGQIEEAIKRYRQEIVWIEITKQTELMEYMCDKGIFTDLETIKAIMIKNPEYPRKKIIDKKIKLWDHEYFLQNVPL